MANALITRKGGSTKLTGEKLASSNGGGSITLEKDYAAIVVTRSVDGKRTQAGMPSCNVNGLTELAGASTGNWGYNGSIGKDNDYVTATNVYGSAKKGHSISWGGASNGWGHVLIVGILSGGVLTKLLTLIANIFRKEVLA